MNAPVNLQARRRDAERRLDALRKRQGKAILDGEPTADIVKAIAEIEMELAGFDAAQVEAERREAIVDATAVRTGRTATIATLREADQKRAASVRDIQLHGTSLAAAVAGYLDAAAECDRLARLLGFAESDLAEPNVLARAGDYVRTSLRAALNRNFLGHWPIGPQPRDPEIGSDWGQYELRRAGGIADTAESKAA